VFNVTLQPTDDDLYSAVSGERFHFSPASSKILNYGFPHQVVHPYGQDPQFRSLPLLASSYQAGGRNALVLAPVVAGFRIMVDGAEYEIAVADRLSNPHLELIRPAGYADQAAPWDAPASDRDGAAFRMLAATQPGSDVLVAMDTTLVTMVVKEVHTDVTSTEDAYMVCVSPVTGVAVDISHGELVEGTRRFKRSACPVSVILPDVFVS